MNGVVLLGMQFCTPGCKRSCSASHFLTIPSLRHANGSRDSKVRMCLHISLYMKSLIAQSLNCMDMQYVPIVHTCVCGCTWVLTGSHKHSGQRDVYIVPMWRHTPERKDHRRQARLQCPPLQRHGSRHRALRLPGTSHQLLSADTKR